MSAHFLHWWVVRFPQGQQIFRGGHLECERWLASNCKLDAMQADLEEGRTVFEEGTAFTIQGLEHEVRICSTIASSPPATMLSYPREIPPSTALGVVSWHLPW